MKVTLFILSLVLIASCNTGPNTIQSDIDLENYKIVTLEGNINVATKISPEGFISEKGYTLDGKKMGQWLKFNKNGKIIESTNYLNNIKFGNVIKYDGNTGNIKMTADYKNNLLDGESIVYEGRRKKEIFNYSKGELNGLYTQFFSSGKKQKEVNFVAGVQNGSMRYYDEVGNLTMEYLYKDGKKVSGGIIE